jgi:hypothetical protein
VKELTSHIKEEIGVHAEKQHEKQKKFIGRFKRHNGHTVWQINLKTMEVEPVKYSEEFAKIDGKITRNIVTAENHWYCSALNKENAFRKFNLMAKAAIHHHHDRVQNNRQSGG